MNFEKYLEALKDPEKFNLMSSPVTTFVSPFVATKTKMSKILRRPHKITLPKLLLHIEKKYFQKWEIKGLISQAVLTAGFLTSSDCGARGFAKLPPTPSRTTKTKDKDKDKRQNDKTQCFRQ